MNYEQLHKRLLASTFVPKGGSPPHVLRTMSLFYSPAKGYKLSARWAMNIDCSGDYAPTIDAALASMQVCDSAKYLKSQGWTLKV